MVALRYHPEASSFSRHEAHFSISVHDVYFFLCHYLHLGGVLGSLSSWELRKQWTIPARRARRISTFRSRPVFIIQGALYKQAFRGVHCFIKKSRDR